jgi:predicted DNA-binding protein (UPF0251 family)
LTKRQKEAIGLTAKGLTQARAAQIAGVSRQAINQRLRRANIKVCRVKVTTMSNEQLELLDPSLINTKY